jgi:hypothetical protein
MKISSTNFDEFRRTIQKSYFGEENFKRELYLYHANKRTDCASIIELYVAFGVITVDLINMIEWIKEDTISSYRWVYLEKIKQVSDERIVNRLFESLDSTVCSTKADRFASIVRLFVNLAKNHSVSLLEIHQRFSSIINKILFENNNEGGYDEQCIFDQLLNLSCVKNEVKSVTFFEIFTEKDINEAFEEKILDLDKSRVLFLEKNVSPTISTLESSNSIYDDQNFTD